MRANGGDYGPFKDSVGQVGIVERAHGHTRVLTDLDQIELINKDALAFEQRSVKRAF